jgi:hypothetical protein
MASLAGLIEGRLRPKINREKSAVARPTANYSRSGWDENPQTGNVESLLSERTKRNAMQKTRALTPRS